MKRIGYARVSTPSQNLDRQIAALRTEGCDEIFREKASGKDIKNRPQLEKAIDELGTGDILVVAEWDRATRSMLDSQQSQPNREAPPRISQIGIAEGSGAPSRSSEPD